MRRLIAPIVTLSLIAGACGGNGGGDDRAATLPTDKPAETTAPSDKAKSIDSADTGDLKAKLLAVADMPTGYSEEPPDASEEDGDSSDFCKELQAYEDKYKAPEKAEVTFQKGEPSLFGGANVVESLGRFESEARATEAFDAAVDGLRKCRTFEQTDEDGTFKGSFTALSFPKLADDTFAAHLSGTGGSEGFNVDIAGDFVAVRANRVIVLVATITFGAAAIPASELETIVRTAVDKL